MPRLPLLVDEHVPSVFTNALRSSGFDVSTAQERFGQESVDKEILRGCAETGTVLVTNDRDFLPLADGYDHAGVVLYTDRAFLLNRPSKAVEAMRCVDRHYRSEELRNVVEWLDNWW